MLASYLYIQYNRAKATNTKRSSKIDSVSLFFLPPTCINNSTNKTTITTKREEFVRRHPRPAAKQSTPSNIVIIILLSIHATPVYLLATRNETPHAPRCAQSQSPLLQYAKEENPITHPWHAITHNRHRERFRFRPQAYHDYDCALLRPSRETVVVVTNNTIPTQQSAKQATRTRATSYYYSYYY